MQRPQVGDRWQNRRTIRVCVIEAIEGGPDRATSWIRYRYETASAAGSRRRMGTNEPWFLRTFTPYETACRGQLSGAPEQSPTKGAR